MYMCICLDYLNKESSFWIHCLVSNYVSKWYSLTIKEVRSFQNGIDADLLSQQHEIEKLAVGVVAQAGPSTLATDSLPSETVADAATHRNLNTPNPLKQIKENGAAAIAILHDFQEVAAVSVLQQWWDFFFVMAGKYRDLHHIVDMHAPDFHNASHFIPVPR